MATNQDISIIIRAKDEASRIFGKLSKSMEGLGKTMGIAGVGIAGALAFAAKAAADSEVAQDRFATAMKNSAGATDEQIASLRNQQSALQATTRYEDDAIASAQAVLASYNIQAQSIGMLTPRILDMAEAQRKATGATVDLESVSASLGKAIETGSLDMLQRSLVSIPGATKAMKDLTKANFENADAQQRVAILSKVLDGNFKGLAETSGKTFAGQLDILKNTFGDLSEAIGRQIIPVLLSIAQKITPIIARVTQWMEKNPELAKTLVMVAAAIAGVLIVISALVTAIAFILSPVGAVTIAIAGLVAIGVVLIRHWDYVKKYAGPVFSAIGMVIGAFVIDTLRWFGKLLTSADDVFSAIALAMTGKFSEAKQVLKDAFIPDLKYTKVEYGKLVETVKPIGEDIKATFKGVTDDIKNSLGTTVPAFGSMSGGAVEHSKKAADAISTLKDKITDVQKSLLSVVDEYTKKASDQLDAYQAKIRDIEKDITRLKDDFARDSATRQKSYNEDILKSYIDQQDKLKDLLKERDDLQKKQSNGTATSQEQADLAEIEKRITRQNEILQAYYKERADIATAADAERAKTDLQRLQEKHTAEMAEAQRQFDEKMADLQLKLDAEKAAYEKQKNELIADTNEKYAKLNDEVDAGWKKMLKTTEGHVASMKALESQVMAIKAAIEAARANTSTGAITGVTGKRAAGGPVSAGGSYIVGENGPELFVPNTSGAILPNSKSTAGGLSLTLNIGNFFGGNPDVAARELGDLIIKRLQLNARVS